MRELIKKFADKTFLRFVLVGVINTVFGTAIMFVFYNVFGLSYWLSSASNYFFGSILSYFLNKYFTFQYKKRDWKVVVRFAVNVSVCYLIAYGIAKPLIRALLSGIEVGKKGEFTTDAVPGVSNSVQETSLGGFTLKVIKRPDEGFVNPMLYDQRAILQPSSRPPYFLSPTSGIRRCVN